MVKSGSMKSKLNIKGRHIKILLSVLFITILWFCIDKEKFIKAIQNVPLSLIIFSALFFAITQTISAIKWWVLVRAAGINASIPSCIKAFFIGMYVNTVGVGTVGGDIVRALLIDKDGAGKGACLATVVADRAIGLSVLASIGLISWAAFGAVAINPKFIWVAVIVTFLAILGFCFISKVMYFAGKLIPRFAKYFMHIADAFPKDKKVFAKVICFAAIYHCSQILLAAYIIHGLGVSVPLSYIFFAVPFINLLTTLPLSWMGLGLREGTYVSFFVPAYFSTPESAMLVGSIWFVAMIIASGVGGVVAFISGDMATIRKQEKR